uniref:Uncharacterized protein n=1 Tax=Periophthalmus magnuspinnatus TaxID=409849 RepID=A0A3B4A5P1_9GOBI
MSPTMIMVLTCSLFYTLYCTVFYCLVLFCISISFIGGHLSFSPFLLTGCPLPTCLTVNLVSSLQTGDEKAGKSTTDPLGIGKK